MKSEIRFVDRDHLAFYNQTLNQSGNNDPYHKAFFTSWGSAAKPVATSRKSLTSRRTASAPTAFTTAGRPAAASALPVWPLTCGTVGTATGARRLTTCSIANMRRT